MAQPSCTGVVIICLLAPVSVGAQDQSEQQIPKKPPITSVSVWPDRPPVTGLTPYLMTRLWCIKKFHESRNDGTWDGQPYDLSVRACIAAGG
jgi:hypothetical protein